jgi:predicted nucleotidyltransferase
MSGNSDFQNRVDKLALLYLEKNYDISSMSVEEYIKKFNEISESIVKAFGHQ